MGVRRSSQGSPRRHNLSIEDPNALPQRPAAPRLHGDAFLPVSRAHVARTRVCVRVYVSVRARARVNRVRAVTHAQYFSAGDT